MKHLLVIFTLLCLPLAAQQPPRPVFVQQNSYNISLDLHVKNFGMVEPDVLYRGAQPTGQGFYDLAMFGIKTVVDLRGDSTVPREKVVVESLGMNFVNIPMKGLSAPTNTQIEKILLTLEMLPKPIFVHCQHGEDRTGTVVATWRMTEDLWTNAEALNEAKFFHINWVQFGMKHYIKTFKPNRF